MPDYNPRWTTNTLRTVYLVSATAIIVLIVVLELLNIATLSTRSALAINLVAASLSLFLIRNGYHDQSVILFGSVTWLAITGVVILRGGLDVPATVFYPLVILLLGIFLRPKWAFISGGFSILALLVILVLQLGDVIIPHAPSALPLDQFIFNTVTLTIISAVVFFASRAILTSTAALQESQAREASRREELEIQTIELQHANESLRLSEDRFRSVINNAGDQIMLLDEDGIILDANHQALSELGYSAADLIGTPLLATGVAWDQNRYQKMLENLPFDQATTYTTQQQRSDGSIFPVEIQARKINLGGQTVIIGLFRNITERLVAEEKLRDSQKLQSLGLLAGGVAHDFNNLLVAMIGQTSTAQLKLGRDHPAANHIEKATKAARQAAVITKQLLAFSGRGHFEALPLDINDLIRQNLSLFRVGIPQSVTLRSDLNDNLPPISGDPGQIQQVIMNLIINAAEAIGEKPGNISVYTDTQTISGDDEYYQRLTLSPLSPGRYLSLEITDDGPGIEPDALENIFEPFFSTKTTGHGLGLAAVLGIIRGHHGGLVVYSEKGKGTTFKILLPASDIDLPPTIQHDIDRVPSREKATVLVIDDDQSVRETVQDILEINGHRVIEADSGEAALEILMERAADVDVIILDLTMPGLSGEETLKGIREIAPDHRVILSSGYNHVEAAHRISERSYNAFLQKPYTVDQLIQVVEHTFQPAA